MRVLFVGGTGLISSAVSQEVVAAGHELWLVNRGHDPAVPPPEGARLRRADARDPDGLREVVSEVKPEVVVQWVGYRPEHVAADVETFAGVDQYIFISSASVYEKPPSRWLVRESDPRVNPYWEYARHKIACEELLFDAHRSTGFPATIVRPSLTYGLSQIPVCVGSWAKPYTIVARMRRGDRILVPGDGTSLWTITHNSDFAAGLVGLVGADGAIGEDVHITSQEALTWNQIYQEVGRAAGVEPAILHVPTDALVAADPEMRGSLWGDKAHSTVFDVAKLRRLVPGFEARTPFAVGIAETVAWFDADPRRQAIDAAADATWDRLAGVYVEALGRAGG